MPWSPSLALLRRFLFPGLWLLILIGLLMRVVNAATIAGSYDAMLDSLLYGGQRWLQGELIYRDLLTGTPPLSQPLYALSAWSGSLLLHRLLILLLDLSAALLLARTLPRFAAAGLLPLRLNSDLPSLSALLFVVFSQLFPGGLSGLPHHFANAFLVVALHGIARSLAPPDTFARWNLPITGFCLALAVDVSPRLAFPLLLVTALGLVALRGRGIPAVVWALLAGGLPGLALPLLPLLLVPGGAARAWAGAVLLPLELAVPPPPDRDNLLELFGRLLTINVAGLPLWTLCLLPVIGLLRLVSSRVRRPACRADLPLLLPALSLLWLLQVLLSLQGGGFETEDLQLTVLPLVLVIGSGLAVLERSGRPGWPRLVAVSLLIVSLILANNLFLATLLHPARRPGGVVAALERDRTRVRRHLGALAGRQRGFTAPQDVALQWQLALPASTRGIGPRWSLNQQGLRSSWATRTLALPVDTPQICDQLTAPANRHLVWRRTDPEGPNTAAFLRSCLARQPGRWSDISASLGLQSGEFRVFRRRGP
jgi:hypothetical protein